MLVGRHARDACMHVFVFDPPLRLKRLLWRLLGGWIVAGGLFTAGLQAEEGPTPGADQRPAQAVDASRQSPQELMTQRGFIRFRGAWRTSQEIELIERREQATIAAKKWLSRLDRLRRRLDTPAESAQAQEEISEIADPAAVEALSGALAKEGSFRVRGLYIESLGHIHSGEAAAVLTRTALDHPDPETRIAAVERLVAIGPQVAAPALIAALSGPDNSRINRAAEALGRLGEMAAVAALIDVLETQHMTLAGGGAAEGATSATFTPAGGGLSLGGGAKRMMVNVQNQQVLTALVKLTGKNFQWDQAAWRAWFSQGEAAADCDLRRGGSSASG